MEAIYYLLLLLTIRIRPRLWILLLAAPIIAKERLLGRKKKKKKEEEIVLRHFCTEPHPSMRDREHCLTLCNRPAKII